MTQISTARPGVLRLLRDPTVGWYLTGKVLSSCGIWVQNIAAAVLMYELTRSAFMVGIVSVSQFLGPLLLAVWAGSMSDRVNRRKLLLAGRLLSGLAVTTLAALLAARGIADFGGPPGAPQCHPGARSGNGGKRARHASAGPFPRRA